MTDATYLVFEAFEARNQSLRPGQVLSGNQKLFHLEEDRGHRVAKLMRGDGDKLVARPDRIDQLGDPTLGILGKGRVMLVSSGHAMPASP
jgi:hypothetical protein